MRGSGLLPLPPSLKKISAICWIKLSSLLGSVETGDLDFVVCRVVKLKLIEKFQSFLDLESRVCFLFFFFWWVEAEKDEGSFEGDEALVG